MTIEINTQTTVCFTGVGTVSVRNPKTGRAQKTYTIRNNGLETPLREGRFKKLLKQHNARNRFPAYVLHGFIRLSL